MKKSLVYVKDGEWIIIDNTIKNRIKARLRGFKFVRKAALTNKLKRGDL